MSRVRTTPLQSALMIFAVTCLLTLGACSSSKPKAEEEAAPAATAQSSEEMEQAGARDPGYADTSALVDINFDYDRSDIKPEQRATLDGNAEWIKGNSGAKVQIEGHCDSRGTEEYNLALGERRANAIRDYLINSGVDSTRLYTISYGEELPLDPRENEEAWAANRRAHFLVTE